MIMCGKNNVLVSINDETGELLSFTRLVDGSGEVDLLVDDNEAEFLINELSLNLGLERNVSIDVESANVIIRDCFGIETEEAATAEEGAMSHRGEMATNIINKILEAYMQSEVAVSGGKNELWLFLENAAIERARVEIETMSGLVFTGISDCLDETDENDELGWLFSDVVGYRYSNLPFKDMKSVRRADEPKK